LDWKSSTKANYLNLSTRKSERGVNCVKIVKEINEAIGILFWKIRDAVSMKKYDKTIEEVELIKTLSGNSLLICETSKKHSNFLMTMDARELLYI
jgi:hypothetical protein